MPIRTAMPIATLRTRMVLPPLRWLDDIVRRNDCESIRFHSSTSLRRQPARTPRAFRESTQITHFASTNRYFTAAASIQHMTSSYICIEHSEA